MGDGAVMDEADRTGDDLEPRDESAGGDGTEPVDDDDDADGVSVRRLVRFGAVAVAAVSMLLSLGDHPSDLSIATLTGAGGTDPYLLAVVFVALGVAWLTGPDPTRLTTASGAVAVAGGVVGILGFADFSLMRPLAEAVGRSTRTVASSGMPVAFAGASWPLVERTLRSWYDEATDEGTPAPFENADVLKAVVSLLVALVPWLLVREYGSEALSEAAGVSTGLVLVGLFGLSAVGLIAASGFYGRSAYSD